MKYRILQILFPLTAFILTVVATSEASKPSNAPLSLNPLDGIQGLSFSLAWGLGLPETPASFWARRCLCFLRFWLSFLPGPGLGR